ncbi:1-aminocyclopropane-1-carboxylate synthase [Fagus crenata]
MLHNTTKKVNCNEIFCCNNFHFGAINFYRNESYVHLYRSYKLVNPYNSPSFKELALFQDYHGIMPKNELVEFMAEFRGHKVAFDPKKLVLVAVATSANETLMFCLTKPSEAFLLPTPYYPRFDRDLKWRTGVEIVPIFCSSSNDFRITGCALEDAYQQAKKLNLNGKGVLVTNPSNPLGTTMNRDELNHVIDFAITKKVHIVSDEIYSGTVFDSTSFISIIEALMDRNIDDTHDL